MKLGDVVRVKSLDLIGEVTLIDEYDRCVVMVSGKDKGIVAEMDDLEELGVKQPNRLDGQQVNILGVPYTIKVIKEDDFKLKGADGFADKTVKELCVVDFKYNSIKDVRDLECYQKTVLRHEIIHAFLFESGLAGSCNVWDGSWAENEEMVDWIAMQLPKIIQACKEADAL